MQEQVVEQDRIIVTSDAVDRKLSARGTAVDQHQFTLFLGLVTLECVFHGQPDRFHAPATGRQAVAGFSLVQVARPQAVRTMVAVVHPGNLTVQAHHCAAVGAFEFVLSITPVGATRARRINLSFRIALAVDLFKNITSVVIPTLMFVLNLHFWFLKPKKPRFPAVSNNRLNYLTEG